MPPPTYLKRVYETVRKHGGICIADEGTRLLLMRRTYNF